MLGLLVVHLVLARRLPGLVLWWDGTAYFANARWLAPGVEAPWQGTNHAYHVGWSLLLVPAAMVAGSARDLYLAAVAVNTVVAALVAAPLYALARSAFGLARRPALLATVVGAAYAPLLVQSRYEWSEALIITLTATWAAAVWALLDRPGPWTAVGVGTASLALYVTHPRTIAFTVVGLAVLAGVAVRRRLDLPWAAAGAAIVVLGLLAVTALNSALRSALLAPGAPGRTDRILGRLADPTVWDQIGVRLIGQAWYVLAATAGLGLLGVVVLVAAARHWRAPDDHDRALAWFSVSLLVAAAGVVVAGAALLMVAARVDHRVYGRYVDGFVPVLLVAAAAGVLRARSRLSARALVGVGAATVGLLVLGAAVLLAAHGAAGFEGTFMPLNAAGLLIWDGALRSLDVWRVSGLASAATVVVVVALTRTPVVALAAVPVASVLTVVVVDARALQPFTDGQHAEVTLQEAVHAVTDVVGGPLTVGYEMADYNLVGLLAYGHELFPNRLERFDSREGEAPPTDLVIASRTWPDQPSGAGLVYVDRLDQALWVVPGARQETLRRAGLVALDEADEAPSAFYGAELTLLGDQAVVRGGGTAGDTPPDGSVSVPAGSAVEVRVRVHHAGGGAPWLPVRDDLPKGGQVRPAARWYPAGSDEVVGLSVADLPRPLLPGMAATVGLPLLPQSLDGQPLAPGRYRAVIGLVHEGRGWFKEHGAPEVTLDVEVD